MKTLGLEFYKIKRRKVGLTMAAFLAAQFLWGLWALRSPTAGEQAQGFLSLLYALPVLDAVMVPPIMAILASRLSDIEHKGCTFKQLETLRSPGSLYHAKAVCGLIITAVMFALQFALFILLGYVLGYQGHPDPAHYLLSYVLKLASNSSLFLMQLALSMFFANQMIPLVAGLCGSLIGLLLMFVKFYSFLPWGGNLNSTLVMMDWDSTTRISTYYYREYSPVELAAVAMIFVWIVIFYTAGRILFSRKEN